MASLSKTDSRRMYSWWWNSHISPKNSKWLQENLTDVDIKVKAMIKLIEEDADSFARRAEMYYKKRPELMKLVEELYRAYRALAERYDHATGALRQAHKTMSEAFPNQIPVMPEDPSNYSPCDGDPQTPKINSCFDAEEIMKSMSDFSSPGFHSDTDSVSGGGGQKKHLNESARRGLKFGDSDMADKEILELKQCLAKLEEEKEESLKLYQDSLQRLSKLESEISRSEQDSRELAEKASEFDAETERLKNEIQRLETEKEESLKLYQESLEKITNLEDSLTDSVAGSQDLKQEIATLKEEIQRLETQKEESLKLYQESLDEITNLENSLTNSSTNSQDLKQQIASLKAEKDSVYEQYTKSLQTQSDLEKKLMEAEKEAVNFRKRAEKAEIEIEKLKLTIEELTKEKQAQILIYQNSLETISSLQLQLTCAQEQNQMLEKSNTSLHMELESTVVKLESQTKELTEKQKELGRLWTCIQEERLRFVEAETAFQTLQQLHSQSQEELRSLASELQTRAHILQSIETHNQDLETEIKKQIEDNKNLKEINLSSTVSLKEMESEIFLLKETNGKLEEEVDLRVDQRNALQQEIYCLKEELNEINKNQKCILDQVSSVGLDPESFGSSVKNLQDENLNLKTEMETEKTEKRALLEKLEIMGQLLERNLVLENSLSDLGAELEGVRGKLKSLEESYQNLSEEKSNLVIEKANLLGQLQVTTENLSLVSEKNTVLENSLFDSHVKLEVLKQKLITFEDSCRSLTDEKSQLVSEKGILVSNLETTEKILKDLGLKYTDLESKYSKMEKERDSTLCRVEELNVSLALQNQEHVAFSERNEKNLGKMRNQIQELLTKNLEKSKEFEREIEKSFGSEIEIFILMKCVQDLEENNSSLLKDYQKLLEASELSENLIRVLNQEKDENRLKIESLSDKFKENQEKNTELVVEISILVTFLKQLKTKIQDLEAEKLCVHHDLQIRNEKILKLQSESGNLSGINEELRLKIREGEETELGLRTQVENLHAELAMIQEASRSLEMVNSMVLEENKSLTEDNLKMSKRVCVLEDENETVFDDFLSQSILSHTLKNYVDQKHEEINGIHGDLQNLHGVNKTVSEQISIIEKKLFEVQTENAHLKEKLEKSELDLQKLVFLEDEKRELSEKLSGLESENESVKTKIHEQEEQIQKLLKDNDNLEDKMEESNRRTEEKIRGLEKEVSEVNDDLQISEFYQVLLEEKIRELNDVCSILQEDNASKKVDTEVLNEKAEILGSENGDLKAGILSLRDSILSLENHTCIRTKVQQSEDEEEKVAESSTAGPTVDLQDLQDKVKAIETAVVELQMLSMQEKLDSDAKLESAMKQIEDLTRQKSSNSSRRAYGKPKSTSEISEIEIGILPKDIMLDQASESSSYNVSKRGLIDGEIWESVNFDDGLKSESKLHHHHPTASDLSLDYSPDVVDKLEVSRRFREPRGDDGNKRKVLERLNSDVLKLTNLQITIEDLKRKVEITGRSRRGKGMIECETLKGQLMEAESAIQKLYELNGRLVKHVEGNPNSKEFSGETETESMRRKKVSEQARRVSEKIGRLQLEVQKIQFVLLKLDDEKESKGKTRFLDTKKRVLLKDYLYGGGRKPVLAGSTTSRRNKGHFCACVEPATKGD